MFIIPTVTLYSSLRSKSPLSPTFPKVLLCRELREELPSYPTPRLPSLFLPIRLALLTSFAGPSRVDPLRSSRLTDPLPVHIHLSPPSRPESSIYRHTGPAPHPRNRSDSPRQRWTPTGAGSWSVTLVWATESNVKPCRDRQYPSIQILLRISLRFSGNALTTSVGLHILIF